MPQLQASECFERIEGLSNSPSVGVSYYNVATDLKNDCYVVVHMVRRFKRKSRYLRGSRTHSWGRVGQHRKSGSRGGRGRSGRHKHKWTWVMAYDREYFGKHGFYQPVRVEWRGINVGTLDQLVEGLVERGLASVEGDAIVVDLAKIGYNKLLGGGRATRKLIVRTPAATRTAVRKVGEAGGKVIIVGSQTG